MVALDTSKSRLIIFIILITLTIPSILCSLFIFYHFYRSRKLRQRINNHVVLLLLIITFIQVIGELPITLIFLRTGSAAVSSKKFCQFWIIFDYMLFTGSLWTMAIASIQRYYLVFHRTFFDKYIIFFHYVPLSFCVIYPIILYSFLVTKYSCITDFVYSSWTCGGACYLYEPVLGSIDWIFNGCVNVVLSILATSLIITRVLIQKCRATTQRSIWNRSRRIIIQLVALSTLYMLVWVPCVICFVITLFRSVPILSSLYSSYLSYYQYLSSLLCPFVCLAGLPEVRRALNNIKPLNKQIVHDIRQVAENIKNQHRNCLESDS
ncbi:unnamed protein product [Adineta steineri]|uniref:G-protein coupled receptors family 1 profile domain-containing protein n=1 Tax=Adineta steineri TaxID=433720 RepID=A0A818UA05_9BILA|nr:unnamed protein product [Adineta steineri]CAF1440543.1 unnamed protein product [Adineta steineri]CAF3694961.1 unnamed protein product [Adineta steineri]CAF3765184.1 unnamed protein product [Adineta steineri]